MPTADVRGQRLYYQDTGGTGLALVLSHGFLMDSEMFDAQVRALRNRHRVITWDQRGHGRTVSTPEPFTYWDSAEDLAGLLDHLHINRAVVGGMSQGGFLSLRFALAHQERTAGLVLIDTQSGVEDPEKALQYDLMHEVWTGSGAADQLLDMVAAFVKPHLAEVIVLGFHFDRYRALAMGVCDVLVRKLLKICILENFVQRP